MFYTSHELVDARYTAITGSSINLSKSSHSSVYLRVSIVDDEYWTPYKENNNNVEIIVTYN